MEVIKTKDELRKDVNVSCNSCKHCVFVSKNTTWDGWVCMLQSEPIDNTDGYCDRWEQR